MGGQYWFERGVNLNAIIAWAIGFAIYLGFSPMLMEKVLQIKAAFPWPLGFLIAKHDFGRSDLLVSQGKEVIDHDTKNKGPERELSQKR